MSYLLLQAQLANLQSMVDNGTTFEEARRIYVKNSTTGLTIAEATNLIDRAEEATGLRLRRK